MGERVGGCRDTKGDGERRARGVYLTELAAVGP